MSPTPTLSTLCMTLILIASSTLTCTPLSAHAAAPLKVAFVVQGELNNFGWNRTHENSRRALQRALPRQVSTQYIQASTDPQKAQAMLKKLVKQGVGLIFITSEGLTQSTLAVAKQSPKTIFMICSGHQTATNVGTYFARVYQPRYITGVLAGKQTQSNKIGYVAQGPSSEIIRGLNAFMLGVNSVNPDATVLVKWTHSGSDENHEAQAAEALIALGVDVLAQHQETQAVGTVARAHDVSWLGYYTDMATTAPEDWMTAPVFKWDAFVIQTTQAVLNHQWQPNQYWGGMETGIVGLSPFGSRVDMQNRNLAISLAKEIIAGKLNPFVGPITDGYGKMMLDENRTASDQDLLSMNYFVNGIRIV